MNEITYCGVHFKICPLHIREAFARVGSPALLKEHFSSFFYEDGKRKRELVVINTCNRFDLCLIGPCSDEDILEFLASLLHFSQQESAQKLNLQQSDLRPLMRLKRGADAISLLFKVTASLDSLVLGESQIFGQVKKAFFECHDADLCAQKATELFHTCFHAVKRVRTETAIGKNAVSIGNAALEVTKRVFDDLTKKKVLILGAGEMGKLLVRYFAAAKTEQLFLANRTYGNAEKLKDDFPFLNLLSLAEALERLSDFDICVVCVSGNEYLIQKEHMKNYTKKRRAKSAVMVDLSVPRKIDPRLSSLEDLFVFNIDDLDSLMEHNRNTRQEALLEAENLLEEEVENFLLHSARRMHLEPIGRLHRWVREIISGEVERYFLLHERNSAKEAPRSIIADAAAKKITTRAVQLLRSSQGEELKKSLEIFIPLSLETRKTELEKEDYGR